MTVSTCQFCEKFNGRTGKSSGRSTTRYDGKIKYGTRHYAHFDCFLDAKGVEGLRLLHDWQIAQFPWQLIKERGIEKEIRSALDKREGK